MTIALVVGVVYLTAGFAEQRYTYLWVVLGTLAAVAVASLVSHQLVADRGPTAPLIQRLDEGSHATLAALCIGMLFVAIIAGAYALAYNVGPPLNHGLDEVFGPPPVIRPRP
jgi:hypothetical protein